MTLVPGTRLGPYDIQSVQGAGGMGEVHLARDAASVLSADFAGGLGRDGWAPYRQFRQAVGDNFSARIRSN